MLPEQRFQRLGTGGVLLLVISVLVAAVTHGYNAFRYPLYLTDEGIYLEQAWSVLREGRLSPYTYFYDHAPMGWLAISAWVGLLPDQFSSFGFPINSGRVLMVLVHVGSAFLLFEVIRRYSGSLPSAFLAVFLFNVSPLAVYYQRQVLLDNLMVFWVLLGLYVLARKDGRLVTAMGAGLAFGLAMITKENAVFMLPGFAYLMHHSILDQPNRRFSASFWWFTAATPVVGYLLSAQIKSELVPAGMSFDLDSPPADHVSLMYTVWWQLNRTAASGQGSAFADLLRDSWLVKDRYLLLFGLLATLAATAMSLHRRYRDPPLLGAALLAIGYSFYLARSILLDFYVAPLVPLLLLNIGLLYARMTRGAKRWVVGVGTAVLVALPLAYPNGYLFAYNDQGRLQLADQYRLSLTDLQHAQLGWVHANVPPESRMIIDDDLWVALRDGNPVYPNAHSHWKAAADPDVRDKIFNSDWQNLDYVVMSNRMRPAMERNGENWILQAIDEHGERVWQASRGNVELEIIKIGSD